MCSLFMGQKSCFPTIKPSLLFLDVHVHSVIMTGRERMPTDSHGSLHCCIFKNVSGLNCLKFCSRGRSTTGGIISKWNDFHPRRYLSLQISAPGPSFQQAGRSLGILMLNVRNALDTVVGAPVQAVVLSEVRACSGCWALVFPVIPGKYHQPGWNQHLHSQNLLPFPAPSAMDGTKQETNLFFHIFFSYVLHWGSPPVYPLVRNTDQRHFLKWAKNLC